ncbi:peptidoglycan-binding domain-containing protein [Deinococcus sp.]|uniref:peptidoglycan-binding domain-containing protein n=1 Tax=Deinococcus sp. TaxID=47478 RepID=UPI0025D2317D|nr:peptidoglycan-binding domain-containing protein [Deinococcus sp.]
MNRLAATLMVLPCLLLPASMSAAATNPAPAPSAALSAAALSPAAPSPAALSPAALSPAAPVTPSTAAPSAATPSTALPPALPGTASPGGATGALSGVPTPADIEAAAVRLAGALGGVLRNCPAAYAAVGTPGKRCLGLSGDVDAVRAQLSSALGDDLYGVWRSRDDQRTVFNWIKAPSGAVYLRVAADPANPARSLAYLDAPTVQASELNAPGKSGVSTPSTAQGTPKPAPPKPAPPKPAPPKPAPIKPVPTSTVETGSLTPSAATITSTATSTAQIGGVTIIHPVHNLAPLPFARTLELRSPRLSGPDVLAVQNRLIALTIGAGTPNSGSGKGDGWYGPNTARAVHDFQSANGLRASGKVDRASWDALFSGEAKGFKAGR